MSVHAFIVDGNSFFRQTVCQMLELCGYVTVVPSDLVDATKTLNRVNFELLVVGTSPCPPYYETLANLAKRLQPSIRILGVRADERMPQCVDGAHAFVRIPFTLAQLQGAISQATDSPTTS